LGFQLSRANALYNRRRKRKSCHGCAHEWADACDHNNLHLPSQKRICEDCARNPKPARFPTVDRFVSMRQMIDEAVPAT